MVLNSPYFMKTPLNGYPSSSFSNFIPFSSCPHSFFCLVSLADCAIAAHLMFCLFNTSFFIIVDLDLIKHGDLVSEESWCVIYGISYPVHFRVNKGDMRFARNLVWHLTHMCVHTYTTHTGTNRLTYINIC